MGPPSYMRYIVDRNVVMRCISVCLGLRKNPAQSGQDIQLLAKRLTWNVQTMKLHWHSPTTPFGSYPYGIIGMIIIRTAAGCFRSRTRCRPDSRMCRVLRGHSFPRCWFPRPFLCVTSRRYKAVAHVHFRFQIRTYYCTTDCHDRLKTSVNTVLLWIKKRSFFLPVNGWKWE